jgi:hypothetical protein
MTIYPPATLPDFPHNFVLEIPRLFVGVFAVRGLGNLMHSMHSMKLRSVDRQRPRNLAKSLAIYHRATRFRP